MSEEKKNPVTPEALSEDERMAIKYRFLRDKILENFNKGKRILKITKLVIAAVFVLFTLIGIYVSHRTGHEIQWLQAWIILIFVNVALSVIADYSKYLVEAKVIPYLEDDNEIEFGEYDIFLEDIDGDSEDDGEEDGEE